MACHQANIWTNAEVWFIWLLETREMLIEIIIFSHFQTSLENAVRGHFFWGLDVPSLVSWRAHLTN